MKIRREDYAVHNAMEEVADQAVERVLSEDRTACDCPICREDIKSQMLNNVQPQYYPVIDGEPVPEAVPLEELDTELFNKVMVECYKALTRVKQHPRHGFERVPMHNTTGDLLRFFASDILSSQKLTLSRDDLSRMMASALNGLKPSYTTTHKGDAFIRASEIDAAYRAQVYSEIFTALEKL
jgi:hypothetical protein